MSAGADCGGRIEIDRLSLRVGAEGRRFEAVQDVSLRVAPGEFVCLLGPSGCGKSTLLGALAGHLRPSAGRITLDGAPVDGPDPQRGLVFQQHTLFPWQRTIGNVAFGLKMKGVPRDARQARARELLALVGLSGFEQAWPHQLSGGMQQRVELARALVNQPRVLLMDEPFGALDAQTRVKMQELLLDVWSRLRTTIVFVTHDIDEALFLADRIVVMSARPGRVLEELAIGFPRPRRAQLATGVEFVRLKRHCLDLLHGDRAGAPLERLDPLGVPAASRSWQFAI